MELKCFNCERRIDAPHSPTTDSRAGLTFYMVNCPFCRKKFKYFVNRKG